MEFICKIMIFENSVLDHKQIIEKLDRAIGKVEKVKSDAPFKWKDTLRRSLRDFKTCSGLDSTAWDKFRSRLNTSPSTHQYPRSECSSSFKKITEVTK